MDPVLLVFLLCLFLGSIVGIMAGLLGIGGGLIIVPAFLLMLQHLFDLSVEHSMPMAVATSLSTVIFTGLSSARTHLKLGNIDKEIKHIAEMYSTENELHSLDLYKLMKAFKKLMEKMEYRENKTSHTVVKHKYTIKSQKTHILKSIKDKTKFEDLFLKLETRIHAVFTFLAMLELIQEHLLKINIGEGKNNFWLSLG